MVTLPTAVTIVKSIVYRWPYASPSPRLASPVRATARNLVRSFGASAAVNPSATAKTRALCRPRGLSGFRQYSDSFRISTIARAPFGRRTTRHYAPGVRAATISRFAERLTAKRPHLSSGPLEARLSALAHGSEGLHPDAPAAALRPGARLVCDYGRRRSRDVLLSSMEASVPARQANGASITRRCTSIAAQAGRAHRLLSVPRRPRVQTISAGHASRLQESRQ